MGAGADFVSREASEAGRARAGYLSFFLHAPGRALGAWACGPGRPGAGGPGGQTACTLAEAPVDGEALPATLHTIAISSIITQCHKEVMKHNSFSGTYGCNVE